MKPSKILIGALSVHLFIIISIWYNGSFDLLSNPGLRGLAFGRLFGMFAVSSVLGQFLLIGRIPLIEKTFGLDKLARIHRLNGKLVLMFVLLHVFLITNAYAYLSSSTYFEQVVIFLTTTPQLVLAYIALILFLIIVVTSLAIIRLKLSYEMWYVVHLLTYIATLTAFFHQRDLGGDFLASQLASFYWLAIYVCVLGLFGLYRIALPAYLFFVHRFDVSDVHKEGSATTITISGKNIERFPRMAGQFMILRFLDRTRWWEAHPFSLSWGSNHENLRVTIKNDGDFTSKVSQVKVGTPVVVDGMYGIFTKEVMQTKKVLLIAGGIGVTPIRSLFEDLLPTHDIVFIHSAKTNSEFYLKNEIEKLAKGTKAKLTYIESEKEGRLDKVKLMALVGDITTRDVYVCGPRSFMHAVVDICKELGVPKKNIHFEKFSLH